MGQIPLKDLIRKRIDEEVSKAVEEDDIKIREYISSGNPVFLEDGEQGFMIPIKNLWDDSVDYEMRVHELEKKNPGTLYMIERRVSKIDKQEVTYLFVGILNRKQVKN